MKKKKKGKHTVKGVIAVAGGSMLHHADWTVHGIVQGITHDPWTVAGLSAIVLLAIDFFLKRV